MSPSSKVPFYTEMLAENPYHAVQKATWRYARRGHKIGRVEEVKEG